MGFLFLFLSYKMHLSRLHLAVSFIHMVIDEWQYKFAAVISMVVCLQGNCDHHMLSVGLKILLCLYLQTEFVYKFCVPWWQEKLLAKLSNWWAITSFVLADSVTLFDQQTCHKKVGAFTFGSLLLCLALGVILESLDKPGKSDCVCIDISSQPNHWLTRNVLMLWCTLCCDGFNFSLRFGFQHQKSVSVFFRFQFANKRSYPKAAMLKIVTFNDW